MQWCLKERSILYEAGRLVKTAAATTLPVTVITAAAVTEAACYKRVVLLPCRKKTVMNFVIYFGVASITTLGAVFFIKPHSQNRCHPCPREDARGKQRPYAFHGKTVIHGASNWSCQSVCEAGNSDGCCDHRHRPKRSPSWPWHLFHDLLLNQLFYQIILFKIQHWWECFMQLVLLNYDTHTSAVNWHVCLIRESTKPGEPGQVALSCCCMMSDKWVPEDIWRR